MRDQEFQSMADVMKAFGDADNASQGSERASR
jgi:hypothetical protein